MKNKILISLMFLICILFIPSICHAFIVDSPTAGEVDLGDIELLDYVFVLQYSSGSLTRINVYTSNVEFSVNGNNMLLFNGSGFEYIYWSNNKACYKYSCDSGTVNSLVDSSYSYLYANFDLKYPDGTIFFDNCDVLELNLMVSPSEETKNVPVLIISDWYSLDKWNTSLEVFTENQMYDVYMHIPQVENPVGIDDKVCSVEVKKDEKGRNLYRYIYKVYRNGTYRFKLTDINGLVDSSIDEPSSKYVIEETIEISNIVASQDTVDNYVGGRFDPTPFLSYEYVSDTEIYITTQKFFMHELIDLQCFIAKDIDIKKDFNDSSKWTKLDVRTFKDEISQDDVYQFYYSVKNDNFDGNGTYYVKFYNVFIDKYRWSSIDIDFDKILAIDGSWHFKYVSFFRERFGFLVYPFDLAINVLNKVKNIQFEEPAFDIPQINEPFTKQKLIGATHFSFNNLLENEVFNNIHNIYLVVVDVIIIFALVNLLKHKIMGVFEK